MYNVAVDVGGTFTDVLVFDEETGGLTEGKVLSTPEDPSKGVVEGIEAVCEKVGISFPDLHLFFHGTTVVTNMILTNTGSRVGLLTTKGHEQILHLARAWTPGPLYGWMALQKPDPPADLTDTVGISERINSSGEVLTGLDENEVGEAVRRLVDRGVESLAVGFLNSYVNPSHERRARDIVREAYPDLSVSISADIGQEYGEYERTLTTVVNSAVQPRTMLYMRNFEKSIDDKRFGGALSIVRSDGGAMSTEAVAKSPIQIALSGPSGGVTGSAYLAREIGVPDILTFDMGGTSTDVSLCLNGETPVRRDIQLGYFQFKSPAVDVHSVGAGGGSIAFVSASGGLQARRRGSDRDRRERCAAPHSAWRSPWRHPGDGRRGGERGRRDHYRAARDGCRGGGRGDHRDRQREHARRPARGQRRARARPEELRTGRLRRGGSDARERAGSPDPLPLRDSAPYTRRDERIRVPLIRHPERVPGDVPARRGRDPGTGTEGHDRGAYRAGRRVARRRGCGGGQQALRPLCGLPLLSAEHPDPLPVRARGTRGWKQRLPARTVRGGPPPALQLRPARLSAGDSHHPRRRTRHHKGRQPSGE